VADGTPAVCAGAGTSMAAARMAVIAKRAASAGSLRMILFLLLGCRQRCAAHRPEPYARERPSRSAPRAECAPALDRRGTGAPRSADFRLLARGRDGNRAARAALAPARRRAGAVSGAGSLARRFRLEDRSQEVPGRMARITVED